MPRSKLTERSWATRARGPAPSDASPRAALQMRLVGGTLEVAGDLDLASAAELERVLGVLATSAVGVFDLTDLHLDLRQVGFIDTAGLNALAAGSRAAAAHGRQLTITTSDVVERTIERAGLAGVLLGG